MQNIILLCAHYRSTGTRTGVYVEPLRALGERIDAKRAARLAEQGQAVDGDSVETRE